LDFLQAIDVVELTSYLAKVGFQNRCAKDVKLAVDQFHKNFNGKLLDDEIKLQSLHGVGQKLPCCLWSMLSKNGKFLFSVIFCYIFILLII